MLRMAAKHVGPTCWPNMLRMAARSLRSSAERHDVVVVGGGVMGAWTACMAAKRGASVCLVDQHSPGHTLGSSHGDGRIFRLAYSEDDYVDMMLHSLPLWHELDAFADESLIATTGGLNIAQRGRTARAAAAGEQNELDSLRQLYVRRGIAHELLSSDAVNERFPQFHLAPHLEALYQPDFGVLFASRCLHASWKYAESLGVTCVSGFRASRLVEGESDVTLISDDGRELRSSSCVLAPGAWLSKMAESLLSLTLPTRVSAETVCYYAPTEPSEGVDHSYRSMPVFIFHTDNHLGSFGYYGLPMIDVPGIKASAHYCGPTVDPDHRPSTAGGSSAVDALAEAAAAQRVADVVASTSRLMQSAFPHVEPTPFSTQSCLYTATPDHDYVLSLAPSSRRVVLAGGGSGHAFKMGPAIGDCAAALALGDPPPLRIERFRAERFAGVAAYEEPKASRR